MEPLFYRVLRENAESTCENYLVGHHPLNPQMYVALDPHPLVRTSPDLRRRPHGLVRSVRSRLALETPRSRLKQAE